MAQSNHERVRKALETLKTGLFPFFERELKAVYGDGWEEQVYSRLPDRGAFAANRGAPNWDCQAMLAAMWDQWNEVFRRNLGFTERSIISELRDTRNNWAHQRAFNLD